MFSSLPLQWGQNSGHIGVPLESIPAFVQRLQQCYTSATGQAAKKSPGGPKSGIAKKSPKGKDGKGGKGKGKRTPRENKGPKTMEDLDADLVNYTAGRGGAEMAAEPTGAAAPAEPVA